MITLIEDWTDRQAWDDFVARHDEARFCHLFSYGDALRCYGYRPARVAFVRDGTLVAVFPAAIVHSVLFGWKLVSQPFQEYGGLLADPAVDPADVREIVAQLDRYAKQNGKIRVIETHGNQGIAPELSNELFSVHNKRENAQLRLDRPVDELWQKVVRYSVRKAVNQARGRGLEVVEKCDETVIRDEFFPLYLKSMMRLGVPPHRIEYYLDCYRGLGDAMKIFWAIKDGTIRAGLLGFACGSRINILNTVSTPEAWEDRPNDLIHWEFVKWAAEAGYKVFDFGSVRYDGQRTYKQKWGCVFADHYDYLMFPGRHAPAAATFNSSSDVMSRMSKVWAAYMPDSVGAVIGPMIRKHLVR